MFSKLNYFEKLPLFLPMCFVVGLLVRDAFRVHHLTGSLQLFFVLFPERCIEFVTLEIPNDLWSGPSEEIYYTTLNDNKQTRNSFEFLRCW